MRAGTGSEARGWAWGGRESVHTTIHLSAPRIRVIASPASAALVRACRTFRPRGPVLDVDPDTRRNREFSPMRTPALGCMLIPGPHHAMSNATRLIRQRRQGGPMDTDRIANLLRALRTSPSRRAVTTAVVALAVSTPLAPLFGHE